MIELITLLFVGAAIIIVWIGMDEIKQKNKK